MESGESEHRRCAVPPHPVRGDGRSGTLDTFWKSRAVSSKSRSRESKVRWVESRNSSACSLLYTQTHSLCTLRVCRSSLHALPVTMRSVHHYMCIPSSTSPIQCPSPSLIHPSILPRMPIVHRYTQTRPASLSKAKEPLQRLQRSISRSHAACNEERPSREHVSLR